MIACSPRATQSVSGQSSVATHGPIKDCSSSAGTFIIFTSELLAGKDQLLFKNLKKVSQSHVIFFLNADNFNPLVFVPLGWLRFSVVTVGFGESHLILRLSFTACGEEISTDWTVACFSYTIQKKNIQHTPGGFRLDVDRHFLSYKFHHVRALKSTLHMWHGF